MENDSSSDEVKFVFNNDFDLTWKQVDNVFVVYDLSYISRTSE